MKDWQKIFLDSAAHITLRQLGEMPQTKQEITEATGIGTGRMEKLVKKLLDTELIDQKIESGTRKLKLNIDHGHVKQLRIEIEDHTTNEVEDLVKSRNFHEARQEIHRKPYVEDLQKRKALAKIEALQKLEQLPQNQENKEISGRWQSLKGFIPRL